MGYEEEFRSELNAAQKELANHTKDIALTKKDIEEIKLNVTNHLPHKIDELRQEVQVIGNRIIPFETEELKRRGRNDLVKNGLTACVALAALTWTTIQILEFLSKHLHIWS